jgi:pimeloyl-ACP methyl ester carboxylesterase
LNSFPRESAFVDVNDVRLHYLDWGGDGPALLFLAGMGCNAYIFDRFAGRFTCKFHVLALTRRGHGDSDHPESGYDVDTLTEDLSQFLDVLGIEQAILAGHSLGYLELCHFAALYPQRVLKLVFLDAAYDSTSLEYQVVMEKNPLRSLTPAWPENCRTIEEYLAKVHRLFPAMAAIWGDVMEEQSRHELELSADGKVVDKMTEAISQAIWTTVGSYVPEYASIQAPTLSFFAIRDGTDYLSDSMTVGQKAQVTGYFTHELAAQARKEIDHFRQAVPQAKIIIIPQGHHYCFIKQEELVFGQMSKFLSE